MTLKNYPGAKRNSGILQFIINNIPAHRKYFELFAGSAQLFKAKKPAKFSFLSDIDSSVIEALGNEVGNKADLSVEDCFSYLLRFGNSKNSCIKFNNLSDIFIYLDPPYPFSARRYGKKYYKHEMTDDDHVRLLSAITKISTNIMVSTRQNDLYDIYLKDWRKKTFRTVDRAGACEEIIYMNYPEPEFLHQYDYVGQGFSDRQRISRKVKRFEQKLAMLQDYERHLFIQEIIRTDPDAVKHFLAMQQGK